MGTPSLTYASVDAENYRRVDRVESHGRWAFDAEVTACFDDMLARSIPGYAEMRRLSSLVAARFARGGLILDLGCSRGGALRSLIDDHAPPGRLVGFEQSPDMVAAAVVDVPEAEIREFDFARRPLPIASSSVDVVLAVLALQFTPIERRPQILGEIRRVLAPGGALVLVEKVISEEPEADALLTDLYLDGKRAAGYSEEQILAKRAALEGVLVPVSARMNEAFLVGAGFRPPECFWRSLNFAGWLALPGPPSGSAMGGAVVQWGAR